MNLQITFDQNGLYSPYKDVKSFDVEVFDSSKIPTTPRFSDIVGYIFKNSFKLKLNRDIPNNNRYVNMPSMITINNYLNKEYAFIQPIQAQIIQELDYYLCQDNTTNAFGIGGTIHQAKEDYCSSLIELYKFLNRDRKNIFKGYKEQLDYLDKILQKK